jgi:hypothetical protein
MIHHNNVELLESASVGRNLTDPSFCSPKKYHWLVADTWYNYTEPLWTVGCGILRYLMG